MASAFESALKHTLGIEGDYSDDPVDRGGQTRFGVTKKLAQAYGYRGPMDALPLAVAESIYEKHFWKWMELDDISDLSEPIALELFDTGVNVGRSRAVEWMQRLLNALNNQAQHYPDISVDGLMGPQTLGALKSFLRRRGKEGETVFLKGYNAIQGGHYLRLAESSPSQERFFYGWLRTRL